MLFVRDPIKLGYFMRQIYESVLVKCVGGFLSPDILHLHFMRLGQYLHFLDIILRFTLGQVDLDTVIDIRASPKAEVSVDVPGCVFGVIFHIEYRYRKDQYVCSKLALLRVYSGEMQAYKYLHCGEGQPSRYSRKIRLMCINWGYGYKYCV